MNEGVLRGTSLSKLVNQMRRATDFLPKDVPARLLNAQHFREAKASMAQAKLGRRTRSNLLSAAVKLLEFVHEHYMGGVGLPAGLADAVEVKSSRKKVVKIYSIAELKRFLKATQGTISQLDIMLALNCGMNPQDIGRLRLDEIDMSDRSVFWDREKEPENDIRLHHILWPETFKLVKRWMNDGTGLGDAIKDYRFGPSQPVMLDPEDLAFVDGGRPRYWITPSGSEKNRVSDSLRDIVRGVTFIPLRKTANNLYTDLIEQDDSTDRALAANELSDRFLGHGTETLRIVYRQFKKGAYVHMNRYLKELGNKLRNQGLFESID